MNIDMTRERGYQSALSACPAPLAASVAVPPADALLRRVGVDVRPHLDAVAAATQGTPPPIAGSVQGTPAPIAGRLVADVRRMTLVQFVQPHPGDRARRHPV